MSNLKSNERQNENERKTIKFMMNGYSASDELRERVESAMVQRRDENKRKKTLKEEAVKNAVMRVAVFAAMLTFIITVTPLRGYVANAANSFNTWTQDVFKVDMKETKNGCTIEITEVSVANDFLYLTVNENCEGKKNEDFHVNYSGTISQGLFHKITFDTNDRIESDRGYLERDPAYDSEANDLIKIYIPELKDFITDSNKQYKCKLTANVTDNDGKSLARMKFNFKLGNVDGVLSSKDIPLNYTTKVEDLKFSFEKIEVSNNGTSELFVQIIPQNDFKLDKYVSIYVALNLCNTKEMQSNYMQNEDSAVVYDDNSVPFVQWIVKWADNIYTIDSKYYMVISLNGIRDTVYGERRPEYLDYDSLTDPDVNIYLADLMYDIYNPNTNELVTKYSSEIDKAVTLDLKMNALKNRCSKISDVYVGEEGKNELKLRDQKFIFRYFFGRSAKLLTTYGDDERNDISKIFCTMESARVAAVKDGKIVFTAIIDESDKIESADIHCWTTGLRGDIVFYNSKNKKISCDSAYQLEYDHIVVTNINLLSYDNNGKISYYDSYYNPKYYSAEQCKKDYETKCSQLDSIVIK